MPFLNKGWNRSHEARLVKRARDGDARAFEKLIVHYQKQIYSCVSLMVFSHDAIDDLIQETFIKAFQNLWRFDVSYPFYPWLRRIAVNTTINFLKSARLRISSPLDADHEVVSMDEGADPHVLVEQAELVDCLRRALKELPVEQHAVFVLRTNEGMSYEDIAEALQISIGTVMSRLNRARARLRLLLKDYL